MESEQIIRLYKKGYGAPFIAKKLNTSNYHIYKILNKSNVPIRTHREKSLKYSVNQSIFNQINTEEKAYWLGFIAADGYQSNGYLGCSLNKKDKDHLVKLKNFLESSHPIKTYKQTTGYAVGSEYVRLLIAAPDLCKTLGTHGITERKTHSLKFPHMKQELVLHFIRGYFDGDGSWAKSKKSASGFTMKICGTKDFLTNIAKELKLSPQRVHKHKSIYCLEKSGKDVLRLMNLFYDNATIYLDRKRERWFVAQSLLAEKSIEKPRELLENPTGTISSQASLEEGSTTILGKGVGSSDPKCVASKRIYWGGPDASISNVCTIYTTSEITSNIEL